MNIFMRPILKEIFHCDTYQPYWIKNDDGEKTKNPKLNQVSKKLMDLKDENNRGHDAAIKFFTKALSRTIAKHGLDRINRRVQSGVAIVVVPSSQEGRVSGALLSIAKVICKKHGLTLYRFNPLVRTRTIEKLHSGGDRSIGVHLGSIRVETEDFMDMRYRRILILDDVSTTGNSLYACAQLLENEGIERKNIELLSLLKTA